ncbi:RimK family alpha-L-glutamate ligase [Egicoccus sp. AB-alg2]|uniref:ATP-grasp domain-containing protein n=1 Tax=Egicoccus sp. AB-alg2 TaxID=3242693 RepID=UPI00359E39CB
MQVALVTGSSELDFVADVDVPLVTALEARGVTVTQPRWDDPDVAWESFDAAVVRTTWDYPQRRDEFVAWAAAAGERTRLWNPAGVLRWNTHKSYLLELEERGAPVVPTAWLGQGDRIRLDELLQARGWTEAIVKPAVGAGASGLQRIRAGDPAGQAHLEAQLAAGDVLVQPYLASVETRGELSVVVVDGEVSHAVRKVPEGGEFRIHEEFGGRNLVEEPDADTVALARWIVESTGHDLLLARVDLLEDEVGQPQLIELEATEPDLFLRSVPEAGERIADAVVARLRPSDGPGTRPVEG